MAKYHIPQLVVFCNSERGLLASLELKKTTKPFPFILDIIDSDKFKERNREAIRALEEGGLREGDIFCIRRIYHGFGEHFPMPRLCIGEDNPFELLPFVCYDCYSVPGKAIRDYLQYFREQIQTGLIRLRGN